MKKILIILIVFSPVFACDHDETEPLNAQEIELLRIIEDESANMFSASIKSFDDILTKTPDENLSSLNTTDFSRKAVLNYSKKSDFFIPHLETIEMSVSNRYYQNGRISNNHSFTDKEQLYINQLMEAFSTLPNFNLFTNKVEELESQVKSEIQEEKSRLKLLSTIAVSRASVKYFFDNKETINEMLSEIEKRKNEISIMNGRTDECCFEGELEWSWQNFGGEVIKGGTGGAAGALVVNVVPGAGQASYGVAILGGAIAGGVGYTVGQMWNWMWSTGGGSTDGSLDEESNPNDNCLGYSIYGDC